MIDQNVFFTPDMKSGLLNLFGNQISLKSDNFDVFDKLCAIRAQPGSKNFNFFFRDDSSPGVLEQYPQFRFLISVTI